jgi:hypothetical protein
MDLDFIDELPHQRVSAAAARSQVTPATEVLHRNPNLTIRTLRPDLDIAFCPAVGVHDGICRRFADGGDDAECVVSRNTGPGEPSAKRVSKSRQALGLGSETQFERLSTQAFRLECQHGQVVFQGLRADV